MSAVSRHYVLAAGGTGGHLIPAFALASELIARGHRLALITDARGARIPGRPEALESHVIPAGRIAATNPLSWVGGGLAIIEGRRRALDLIRDFAPSAVVGFGGYPVLPALLAASAASVATVIHEQNAVLGRVNRFFARRVDAIATAYRALDRLPREVAAKVHLVGNPVREPVLALRDAPYPVPAADAPLHLLVTGGSQGARVLSDVVPAGLALLPEPLRARLRVIQQCRPEDIERVRAAYTRHAIAAELATYFEDIASRLAAAHLFIGRAGASTIAELGVAGRPAILVPLAIATDDHQAANTRESVAAGGALAIREDAFTPAALAEAVAGIARAPDTLAAAASAMRDCGRPNAARDLADLVESFGAAPLMEVIRVTGHGAPATKEALALEGALVLPTRGEGDRPHGGWWRGPTSGTPSRRRAKPTAPSVSRFASATSPRVGRISA